MTKKINIHVLLIKKIKIKFHKIYKIFYILVAGKLIFVSLT